MSLEHDPQNYKLVVAGFIFHNEQVLLVKRTNDTPDAPGLYHLPGGHVDSEETVPYALAREIKEELGLTIKVGDPYYVYKYVSKTHGPTTGIVYFAQPCANPIDIIADKDEVAGWEWAEEDQLSRILGKNKDHNLDACILGFSIIRRMRELRNDDWLRYCSWTD